MCRTRIVREADERRPVRPAALPSTTARRDPRQQAVPDEVLLVERLPGVAERGVVVVTGGRPDLTAFCYGVQRSEEEAPYGWRCEKPRVSMGGWRESLTEASTFSASRDGKEFSTLPTGCSLKKHHNPFLLKQNKKGFLVVGRRRRTALAGMARARARRRP